MEEPFDIFEVHTKVTVQILINSKTGESSIGWTRDENTIEDWIRQAHFVNQTFERSKSPNEN